MNLQDNPIGEAYRLHPDADTLWQQARGELLGFSIALGNTGHITADQIRMAIALADRHVWRPIEEPPPDAPTTASMRLLGLLQDGTHVFCHYSALWKGHACEQDRLWVVEGSPSATKPTHWMYLPGWSR